MKSLADALPPEFARQIHPDWRKNEAAYWAVRDQLLAQYQGRWVGFADGTVIAAASTPLELFLAVQQSGRHPFVIRVGHESEPWYRIRRMFGSGWMDRSIHASFKQTSSVKSESWAGMSLTAWRYFFAVPQEKSSSTRDVR
jgi:hypothetical protein